MSTTITGDLHGTDTKDNIEITRLIRTYDYRITASGGGTVRLKIEYFVPPELGVGADYVPGKWKTLVSRFKTDSGQTTSGSFTIPGPDGESRKLKLIFSRGALTQGVDYEYFMEPA